jgi:hypothetical protein
MAFNGKEQILILTTDLQADRETKVLEVMPLPSEPKVTKADATIFRRASALIGRKLPRTKKRGPVLLSLGGPDSAPAARVTLRKRIGAHDISVVCLVRQEGFVAWVNEYLKSQGVSTPTIPKKLAKVVAEYIQEGFTWFVFDVVSLTDQPASKEAIQLRFATEYLYYPLRITRTERGHTTATFLVLSEELFTSDCFLGYPRRGVRLVHAAARVSGKELKALSDEIHTMLGKPRRVMLRNWEIRGKLSSFRQDLVVRKRKGRTD